MRVHLGHYIFSPKLFPTLVTFLLLPFLVSLGTWQLHRAAEKRQMEQDFKRMQKPIDLASIKNLNQPRLRYQWVQTKGHFDNTHLILLDNKTHQSKVGYHVLAPFYIEGENKVLLVNRGFISRSKLAQLPTIEPVEGLRSISGLIYFPSKTLILKAESVKMNWPLILQAADLKLIAEKINHPIHPFYLLLKEGDETNLIREWHPVNFPSYRHLGYAIQWFLLAITLFIIFLALNIKRNDNA